ncbi:catalase [Xylophilus sp.]|uniref:catalase n=1 Tax=Xylophilus sp. TaxID=2653893 RepID=UPI002D80E882|nr:catalase [Xylophilus sp.]
MEDFVLREKLVHFAHERIPERVVHARGSGAHGWFQVYKSMATYTRADCLQDPEQKTPVFVRFSTFAGERGSADTVRDLRGFEVKFYTREGNYDLVGNSFPVFFIQDAMKLPDLVHAFKPEPHHGMPQASSAHDTFWDFASLMPETTHALLWLMSDRAIPRSYRMMEGFGVHTFRFVNAGGDTSFVRLHWKPKFGVHGLAWDEAQKLAGRDPDFHRRDLWESIARGHFPEWELGAQILAENKAASLGFDILDATKLIPEELVPVTPVGRLVLDRNPDSFFAETEQAAFHPGHVVPGIDLCDDPLLHGRLFLSTVAQLWRLGGPNFHELPINRAVTPFHNFQRDGMHRQTVHKGRISYEPHSLDNETEFRVDGDAQGFRSHPQPVEGPKVRERGPAFDDHFSQAALFWNSQSPAGREHIAAAFRYELSKVESAAVRQRVIDNLAHVDMKLARKVAAGVGIDTPDPRAAAGRAGFRQSDAVAPLQESAALGMSITVSHLHTRRVAVLVHDGVDALGLRPLLQKLAQIGLDVRVVGPRVGSVTTAGGRRFEVPYSFATLPSVQADAVLVAGGAESAAALAASGEAVLYVREAYKHAKPVAVIDDGAALLGALGIAAGGSAQDVARAHPGVLVGSVHGDVQADAVAAFAQSFTDSLRVHRYWDRTDLDAIAA